jgi:hypothetical protein
LLFTDNYSSKLNYDRLFKPTASGDSLRMSRSNAEEEQKTGSKEVLSSRGPLWKRDLAAAWAIMDCNRPVRMIERKREDLTDTLIRLLRDRPRTKQLALAFALALAGKHDLTDAHNSICCDPRVQ